MPYCTEADVRSAIDYPDSGAPVSDAKILNFILDSEEEIEDIYKTMFGNVESALTAASGDDVTITVADTPWTDKDFVGYVVWVYEGTNSGEYREITANTDNDLTVSPAFTDAIDNTSKFRITKLGYKDQIVDGSGLDFQFVEYQPLINLNSLTIDSVDVTPSNVFQYKASGRLLLGVDSETTFFTNSRPQLIDIKYVFGVYPMPRIIKRLCIIIAGIRTLTAQIAGTYNDFTSFTLPGGVTANLGEPYTNIREAVFRLQGEARGIVYGTGDGDQVSADFRTNPTYRPFSVFG